MFVGEYHARSTDFWMVRYSTEISWTDDPVVALPGIGFPGNAPPIAEDFTFILLSPENAVEGRASFTVQTLDCAEGDPNDTATCTSISWLPYDFVYRGAGGISICDAFTGEDGTDLFESAVSPLYATVFIDPDYLTLDLKVTNPVTELPDTGSGECAIRTC